MPAQSAPPKISATPSLGWFAAVVLLATAIGVGATVFFFDPGTHGFYPACAFHKLTGWNCPGCGATRALYALLHGNVFAAWRDNALFVLVLAALAVWAMRFGILKLQQQPAALNVSSPVLWGFLMLAVIFGVARNLPGFEWLSPP